MTAPAIFSFENIQVRTLGTSEFPLFVANDIAKALGYQNLVRTVNDRVDPEDLFKSEIETNGGRQLVNCVNESGLYALIFGSKLESAKRFKRWVTSEVLPAIRKNGHYEVSTASNTLSSEEQYEIRKAVKSRAKNSSIHYQTIYNALYDHFKIASYKDLTPAQYASAMTFIQTCELKPQLPAQTIHESHRNDGGCPHCGLHPIPAGSIVLSAHEAENLRTFVYYWRYLFREDLETVLKLMRLLQSPFAPRFYEAVTSMNIGSIEALLERNGYSVRQLSCYRALTAAR